MGLYNYYQGQRRRFQVPSMVSTAQYMWLSILRAQVTKWSAVPATVQWRIIGLLADQVVGVAPDRLKAKHFGLPIHALNDTTARGLLEHYKGRRRVFHVPNAVRTAEFMLLSIRLRAGLPLDKVTSRAISKKELAALRMAARGRNLETIARHVSMKRTDVEDLLLDLKKRLNLTSVPGHPTVVNEGELLKALVRLLAVQKLSGLLTGTDGHTDIRPTLTELEILYEAATLGGLAHRSLEDLIDVVSSRVKLGSEALADEYIPSLLRKMEIHFRRKEGSVTFERALTLASKRLRLGRVLPPSLSSHRVTVRRWLVVHDDFTPDVVVLTAKAGTLLQVLKAIAPDILVSAEWLPPGRNVLSPRYWVLVNGKDSQGLPQRLDTPVTHNDDIEVIDVTRKSGNGQAPPDLIPPGAAGYHTLNPQGDLVPGIGYESKPDAPHPSFFERLSHEASAGGETEQREPSPTFHLGALALTGAMMVLGAVRAWPVLLGDTDRSPIFSALRWLHPWLGNLDARGYVSYVVVVAALMSAAYWLVHLLAGRPGLIRGWPQRAAALVIGLGLCWELGEWLADGRIDLVDILLAVAAPLVASSMMRRLPLPGDPLLETVETDNRSRLNDVERKLRSAARVAHAI